MGNNSTKEARPSSGPSGAASPNAPDAAPFASSSGNGADIYGMRAGRGSRHDVSFFGLGSSDRHNANPEQRKETRQEREARKREKERVARLKERERSMRDESVDGGYLVTLGVYTGPEDFSKETVRQLMVERRLAPFWRGLEDHSDSWTEPQIIAAARGKPIPAPDETPVDDDKPTPFDSGSLPGGQTPSIAIGGGGAATRPGGLDIPAASVTVTSSSVPVQTSTSSPFRHRAKSIATSAFSKASTPSEPVRQELHLPKDPYVHGQRMEVYLYKETIDCPICFREYPPYLNRTRCCDQPICSECFVQIKRPDPHPPEHLDPNTAPPETQTDRPEPDQLVSEPSTCPFCKTPDFGVSYDPPAFRRGLAYVNSPLAATLTRNSSGMSSSTSLSNHSAGSMPQPRRRRGESLSANAPSVITTDMVRPDWAKKLADARAQAARRSAAATALHTAAFLMNNPESSSPTSGFGRRRIRIAASDDHNEGREGSIPVQSNFEQLISVLARHEHARANNDLFPGRGSSRAHNAQDFEDFMIAEAIRQSLADEESRRLKEEQARAKQQVASNETAAPTEPRTTGDHATASSSSALANNSESLAGPADSAKGKARTTTSTDTTASSSAPKPSAELFRPTPLDMPTSTVSESLQTSQHRSLPEPTGSNEPRHHAGNSEERTAASTTQASREPIGPSSIEIPPYLAEGIRRGGEEDTAVQRAESHAPGAKMDSDVSLVERNAADEHTH